MVAVLGVVGLTWRLLRPAQQSTVPAGTVVFEMQTTLLVKVDYSTAKQRVTATRLNDSDDPFLVVVKDGAGREREHCSAGAKFGSVLDAVTKIVAREGISPDELAKRLREPLLGESALLR